MKNNSFENRIRLANNLSKIPEDKLQSGSTKGKYPVVMDGGKTIVYIADESKADETRLKYKLLKESRFPSASGNNSK